MIEHSASCKFCKIPVTLRVHPDALDMLNLEVWVAMAACNRCGDYHTRRVTITNAVQSLAVKWLTATMTLQDPELSEARESFRVALERLTRKLAENAATHYRAGYTWERDWVQQIIEYPDKAAMTCTFFERQMWKTWNKRRHEQAEMATA